MPDETCFYISSENFAVAEDNNLLNLPIAEIVQIGAFYKLLWSINSLWHVYNTIIYMNVSTASPEE